ncbi:Pentachlorophenol 4-monooxygenase [Roseibium album]|nr:Pentachlorophenol 4-monooxygenase [Roseibium album]
MTDVLICGAGPTGLCLAIELARRNIAVRLIERDPTPPANPRAFVLKPSTLYAAEQMGILDEVLGEGVAVETMAYSFEGRIFEVATSPDKRWPWHLNLGEDRLIPILTTRLEALGVVIERGVELTAFEQVEEGIQATLQNRVGREEQLNAGWLVGCDGIHSRVREHTGVEFEGHDHSLHWHVLDAQIDGWPYKDSQGIIFFDSLLASVYKTKDVFRVYSLSYDADTGSWERMRDFLQDRVPSAQLGRPLNDTSFRSVARLCSRFRKGRVLLGGDAAHAMSPSAGLGLNSGVQDALNLGWKLAAVVRGKADEALLETYESERRPAAQAAIETSQRNDNLFSQNDPATRSRAFRKFAVTLSAYLRNGGTGYEAVMGPYGASIAAVGTAPEFGPGAGVHLPSDLRISSADGRATYLTAATVSGSQNLVVFIGDGGIEAESLVESAEDICTRSNSELVLTVIAGSVEGAAARKALAIDETSLLVDHELKVHNLLGVIERSVFWVRPDGRIGFRQDDADDLVEFCETLRNVLPGLISGVALHEDSGHDST